MGLATKRVGAKLEPYGQTLCVSTHKQVLQNSMGTYSQVDTPTITDLAMLGFSLTSMKDTTSESLDVDFGATRKTIL